MFTFRKLLLYFGAILGLSWAGIPYDDIKPIIFDPISNDYEKDLVKAMQDNSKYLPDDGFAAAALETGKKGISMLPLVGDASEFIGTLLGLLNDGSDWRETTSHVIANKTELSTLNGQITLLTAAVKALQTKLADEDGDKENFNKNNAEFYIIYIMNILDEHKSLFKKYALIGGSFVVDLARFIAILSEDIATHDIVCKMRNILLEYRKRTVDARLEKITTEWTIEIDGALNFEIKARKYEIGIIRSRVMSLEYNRNGYNSTSELPCQRFSKESIPDSTYFLNDEFDNDYYYGEFDYFYHNHMYKGDRELRYYISEFYKVPDDYDSLNTKLKCLYDYFGFIRHQVKQLFPVEMFNGMCGSENPVKSTGNLKFSTNSLKSTVNILTNDISLM